MRITIPIWPAGSSAAALLLILALGCDAKRAKEEAPPAGPTPTHFTAAPAATNNLPQRVTFAQHIAPILYQHCSRCHRQGEAGPFPLMSYRDASARAGMIAAVTQARYMPPWPADPSYTHFSD